VVASGELDARAVPRLSETLDALLAEGRTHLVIDMSAATFVDSAMIALLAGHIRKVRGGVGSLAVVCSNENVLETLQVTGLGRELQILAALSEAVIERVAALPQVSPRSKLLSAPRTHAIGLTPHPDQLARARSFAIAASRRAGLDPRRQYNLALAANEAVANAIEHGRPCGDGLIELWADEGPEALTIGVRDGGEFILRPAPRDPLSERGRGLVLMESMVDELSLRREFDHTIVRLSVHR
jgi:anti-anti-sigma factor